MKSFQLETWNEGVIRGIWIKFDLPGEKVNKLSRAVIEEFETLVTDLEKKRSDIDLILLASGKEKQFIAGADIEMIRNCRTEQEAFDLSRKGQQLLDRWEDLPAIKISVIEGPAMGGGCEWSLACDAIIASTDSSTKIGLPETQLGIIPGMGGCVRLTRKIGLAGALDIILAGKALAAERAFRAGYVDAVLPPGHFQKAAKEWAVSNFTRLKKGERIAPMPKLGGSGGLIGKTLEGNFIGRRFILSQAQKFLLQKTKGNYPAPVEVISVLRELDLGFGPKLRGKARERAMIREAQGFAKCAITSVSKNLISLFFATEAVKKSRGVEGSAESYQVIRAGVLGAGVMGGGVAQLAADRGVAIVMKDIQVSALETGMLAASKIFKGSLKKRKITARQAQQKMNLISPTVAWEGLKTTQFVIEAVIEKMDIKKSVFKELEQHISSDAVVASNTSSLSISEMQTAFTHPERFGGMHFFNPVHKMPLIEVIKGEKTSDQTVSKIFQFSKQLGKMPIVVKDRPGFLVNRLLMPYLNEAAWMVSEGTDIQELDKALLKFGMPMGPCELMDEIGIDVGDKVAKILEAAFGTRMSACPMNAKIVSKGWFGKKTSRGFYVYSTKDVRKRDFDPAVWEVLGVKPKARLYSEDQLVDRAILPMINEASRCLEEGVVASARDVDLGMIMGTGFPPFRGGLLRYADDRGLENIISSLTLVFKNGNPRFEPAPALLKLAAGGETFYQGRYSKN